MSFKGMGGSRRLGIAIGCSIVVHVVALCVFLSIGGGGGGGAGPSSEPPPLPPPPAEDDYSNGPSPVADDVQPSGMRQDDADRNAAEESTRTERTRAAETKRPSARKRAESRANAALNKVETAVKSAESTKKGATGKKPTAAKSEDDASPSTSSGEWKNYEVRPGDSLTKIARKCGCTVQELAKANGLKPTANLNLGQTIKIKSAE